jgi:hypothetical protein
MTEVLVSVAVAARHLDVTEQAITARVRRGTLIPVRRSTIRFKFADIEQLRFARAGKRIARPRLGVEIVTGG